MIVSDVHAARNAELTPRRSDAAMVSSFVIALLLEHAGMTAVFVLIGGSMLIVMVPIGVFGPRTNNRALDEIANGEGSAGSAAMPDGAALPTRRS
ncbi:hypothetical protein [Burkholderia metallica]|uniref:hypothetical protein n=1 Tax=Burkholderia metallica TaxID=488729 RepID=UPI00157550C8|nr:hypothetical protein [Burkholderia metallica]